jgi:hypothetical protein
MFYLLRLLIAQEHMYPGSILEGLGSNAVNIFMSIVISMWLVMFLSVSLTEYVPK